MTHFDIWIIVGTCSLCTTLGVYVIITKVIRYTPTPVNTLTRRGDIELIDHIPATQHQRIPDFLGPEYPTHARVSSYYERVHSYFNGNPPSYQSVNPPSYQNIDRFYINSSLEDYINLDYIFLLIFIIIIILLFRKLMISNKDKIIILFVLILGVIYHLLGLLVLIQILIGLIVFFTSNFLSGIYPFNIDYRIIRILSIIYIIYFLWYNSIEIIIHTSVLLPLSIDKIDYLKNLNRFVKMEQKIEEKRLLIFELYKIQDFVNNLEEDNNYIVYIEFHPSMQYNILDAPQLIITEAFLINKLSSPTTIIGHIQDRLFYMADYFYMDDSLVTENLGESGPFILIKYLKFYDI